ncbi:MAG: lamin tail domain-containing protein, partial [Planctomycetaceae bacterium]|nr:lamin tail domain-containing protein [Planctomycetaceae bacterium]
MISRRNRFQSLVTDILQRSRVSRKRKSQRREPQHGVEIMESRALLSATSFVINEIHADPEGSVDGDANGDGTRDGSQDEFVELVNVGGTNVNIGGFTISDAVGVRHTFPADTIVAPGQAVVVFGGGTPTGGFGGSIVQTASEGFLGLNNGGDTVTFSDGTDSITETYGSEGGNDESLTRNPDLTGAFAGHQSVTAGVRFSPGFQNDGTTPFSADDPPIDIVIDYRFDTANFFDPNTADGQAAREILEAAAGVLESRIFDALSAIEPGGGNTWTAFFSNPATGSTDNIVDLEIPENEILIFAGARELGGSTLGRGGPGGLSGMGTSDFIGDLFRDQPTAGDATTANRMDFGPWGGSITFDTSTNWHFGEDAPGGGTFDFFSVAIHELGHVMGVGTADSWRNLITGGVFTGAAAVADQGGNVPVTSDSGHWAAGTSSSLLGVAGSSQEASMSPSIGSGTRKLFTELDFAGLDDLGWDVTTPANPTVINIQSDNVTEVAEGGATDTLEISLSRYTNSDVTVTLTPSNDEIDLGSGAGVAHVVTFTAASGTLSKTVTVTAVDDSDAEGLHNATISFTVASSDSAFDGLTSPDVPVSIQDNDSAPANIWINEIHYDNDGTDVDEFVEIAGAAGTNLSGFSIVLYNGNNGASYGTIDLSGVIDDENSSGFGALEFLRANIQNGAPDGLALVDNNDNSILSFLSYEGTFTATNGPANGMTSVDIGVSEGGGTLVGQSLQRDNSNFAPASDNPWTGPLDDSPGSLNVIPGPELSIAATDADKAEGNSGTENFTFTVTRGGDTAVAASVDYAVTGTGGNAADANDFAGMMLPSGTVNFAAGETTMVVEIPVSGDTDIEADETFDVTLSNPSAGASIATATAGGTIQNDDAAAPEFAIAAADAVKAEGDSGVTAFTFTVTRSGVTTGADTLDFAVTGGATDPAQGTDFDGGSFPAGSVSFADGETTQTIIVNVTGDTDIEPDESFIVTLSNPSRGTIDPATADGVIQDDDTPAANVWINEFHYDNAGGDVDEFVEVAGEAGIDLTGYTIVLYNGSNGASYGTIDLAGTIDNENSSGFGALHFLQSGLQNGAPDGLALVDNVGRVLQFVSYEGQLTATDGPANGLTSEDVGVAETSSTPAGVSLQRDNSAPSPAADNPWKGPFEDSPGDLNTIPAPTYVITAVDAVKAEGDADTTTFLFSVTRNGDATAVGSVDFAVTGDTANPADANDFEGMILPSGTVNFAADDTSETIAIAVTGDVDIEPDEGFVVTLSNPSAGSSITTATAAGTIQNDDSAPEAITVTITEASVSENGGTSAGTVTIPSAAAGDLVITLASDDTSEATVPTSVTIADGQTSASFTVTAVDDALLDGTQTVTVTASATGFTSGDDSLDITDDEFESTELFLNEIMIDPTEASDTSREYIELRGDANGFLPADTYLVLLEGDSTSNPGNIDHVFELGGMQFGANGLLVLLQAGTPYSPASLANTVTATGSGWGTDFSSRTTDIENGSVTFLLIQSATAPTPDADADDNDDGTLNANSWTIRDGIGNIDGGPSDTAYAAINVSGNGNGLTPAGSLLIDISAQDVDSPYHPDYLARIGNSTGSTAADWVLPEVDGAAPDYTLALGATVPAHLGGAPLNHLGATNTFVPPDALFVTIDLDSFSENGGTTTATVRRTQADISSDLVVTLTSSDTTEATVPTSVTIPANAATATFTITGVDDALLDGTQTVTVTASSGSFADGTDTVDVTDDEAQSLVVTPLALTVTEGGSATFDVSLGVEPTADVTVTLAIAGDGDLTLGTAELTFTPGNFGTPQQVTVNAAEDIDLTDGTATVTVSSAGAGSVDVAITEDDNDTLSLVVDPGALTVTEGSAGTLNVSLSHQPDADVTVSLSIAGDGDLTIGSATTLTFTSANFSTTQAVTVNAAEDADTADGVATLTVASAGLTSIDVPVSESDNDAPASGLLLNEILFNPPSGDSPNEYIELRGTPNGIINPGTYLVNIEGDDTDPGDINEFVDLSGLQFGSNGFLVLINDGNGYTIDGAAGQAVDVTDGDQENNSNTFLLIESATAPDNNDDIDSNNDGTPDGSVFAGWTILDGIAILDDDDRDGGTGDNGEFAYASLVFAENAGDGSLLFAPAGATIVDTGITLAGYVGRIGDSTGSTAADWVAGEVDGSAPNFNLIAGATTPFHLGGSPLDHIGSTNAWNPPKTLTVIINEDVISENGGTATATVLRTDGDISAELVVTLSSDDTTEATVPATVTIPAGMAAVDFTITAVDDAIVDSTQTPTITASAATFADGSDSIDVTDDDVQAFVINPTTLSVDEGSSATFDVSLAFEPIADVVIALSIGGDADLTLGTVELTFTPTNFSTPQQVTVNAAEDADAVNGTATVTLTSAGIVDGEVIINENDNDSQGIVVDPTAISVDEGGSNTFDVTLAAQPTEDITVTITIEGDTDVTLGTVELTFTPANFNTPQQVTVNAAEDADAADGTATVTLAATGLSSATVDVTEDDNDAQSLVVAPTTLSVPEGGSATFDVSLDAQPTADVEVTLAIAGDGDLTIGSTTTLTFTAANFSTPQTVTINAAEDADTTNGTATVTVASAGLTSIDVALTEDDNDELATGLLLNEILFNPPSSDRPNEYIELRGTPNGIIADGTYLVNIEGDDNDPGDINEFADLGGLQFGSNGFLVLINDGNGYTIDGAAGQAVDVTDGDQENNSNTFLLIESATAPDNNDDIDDNNDGTPDGSVFAGWTILDGIAILDDDDRDGGASDNGEFAYASLVFAENVGTGDLLFAPAGAEIVNTPVAAGYVGRIGDSTGSTAADWVAGEVDGSAPNFILLPGTTVPGHLDGAPLDHIGSTNAWNPPKTLTVIINEDAISENGGTATATVLRTDGDISAELVVTLNSDDTTEATVPATVTIPAGMAAVDFTITAVDDAIVDSTQTP